MDEVEVLIFQVCDDGSFWGTLNQNLFTVIDKGINSMKNFILVSGNLCPGKMCCVKSYVRGKDMKWCRAKVLSILSSRMYCSHIELLLIDYGMSIVSPLQSTYQLPLEFVDYPPLARQFYLKDVQPSTCNSWGSRVFSSLEKLCGGNEVLVDAKISSEGSAVLYLDTHGTKVKLNFNEYLTTTLKLAEESKSSIDVINIQARKKFADTSSSDYSKTSSQNDITSCFVDSKHLLNPVSLENCGISTYVVTELRKLGMHRFTNAQSYSIPYIFHGKSTVIVSPTLTGKTLSYLLPLLSSVNCKGRNDKPTLLIVVATSWQARSVELQVQRVLSWLNLENRPRCCCAYYASEVEAVHSLINGIDVFITTPPSAHRIYKKHSTLFDQITCVVFDDYNLLHKLFPVDLNEMIEKLAIFTNCQVVVACSFWSDEVLRFGNKLVDPVYIIISAIEAVIRAEIQLNIVHSEASIVEDLENQFVDGESLVICTATKEEAAHLFQVLRINSWSLLLLSEEGFNYDPDIKIIIISDDMLSAAKQFGIQCLHVVHYSPPLTKSSFKLRISFLFKAMLEKLKCKCTVLLNENWKKQSLLLSEMMKRLNLPINSYLENMAAKLITVKDTDREDYDYCYHIKSWGVCRKYNCPSLHKFIQKSSPTYSLILPVDGVVKVKISHVSNASRLWVSLLEHFPATKGCCLSSIHDPLDFKKLSLELAHYYYKKENRKYHVPGTLREGCFCGYQSDNGNYFRVQVLKFSQEPGLYFPHNEKARVRLIDVGSSEIVDVNQLLYLPQEFVNVPTQVLEVYISGLKPKDEDLDWPHEALEFSRNILEDKVLYGRVKLSFGQILWLEGLEYKKLLPDIKVATGLFCPTQEILKMNLAECNTEHLNKVRDNIELKEDLFKKDFKYLNLEMHSSMNVFVSSVDSPSLFYVHPVDCVVSLDEIDDKLNCSSRCSNGKSFFYIGDVCCAQFSQNDRWYRCQILSSCNDKYQVFFVDYGDIEWIENSRVFPLHESLIKLPFQAIQCSLFNEALGTSEEINDGDILWNMTRETVLTLEVKDLHPSMIKGMLKHLVVLKYKSSGENISDVLNNRTMKVYSGSCSDSNVSSNSLLSLLKTTSDYSIIQQSVEELLYNVMQFPDFLGDFNEISSLCQLLSLNRESQQTTLYLLRVLCSLFMFNDGIIVHGSDVNDICHCLNSSDLSTVELTLVLLKVMFPLKLTNFSTDCISLLCTALKRWKSNSAIINHILDLFYFMNASQKLETGVCLICLDTFFEAGKQFKCYSNQSIATIFKTVVNMRLGFPQQYLELLFIYSEDVMVALCSIDILETLSLYQSVDNLSPVQLKQPVLEYISNLANIKCDINYDSNSKIPLPLLKNDSIYHPRICWSQKEFVVLLAVQICGCYEGGINLDLNGLSLQFRTVTDAGVYAFQLDLFSSVSSKEFMIKILMSEVLIKLFKVNSVQWPRLTCSTKRNHFLSYDVIRSKGECVDIFKSAEYDKFHVEEAYIDFHKDDSPDDEEQDFEIGDCQFLFD